jgi:chromosome segregation ATPase
MTNEELNRKMEFLVEWQARFSANLDALKERQEALQAEDERWRADFRADLMVQREMAETALETVNKVAEVVTALAEAQVRTDRQMKETDRHMAETDRRMAETDRQMKETDRRLDRLAALVEGHIRDGHRHDG